MIDDRWGTRFLCLTRGISFGRMEVSGEKIGFTASHHFQVVSRWQILPKPRRNLEPARKPQSCVRCNLSPFMTNIRDPSQRHAEVNGYPVHAEAQWPYEYLAQDFTSMDLLQFLSLALRRSPRRWPFFMGKPPACIPASFRREYPRIVAERIHCDSASEPSATSSRP
jgi:hypothetical protein